MFRRARAATRAARAFARHASTSAPTPAPERASSVVIAARAFVAIITLAALDSAVDDVVLLSHAKRLARAHSTIDDDQRLRDALGEPYGVDAAWWNASVSRAGHGRVVRVSYRLQGERASCDVAVTLASETPHSTANAAARDGGNAASSRAAFDAYAYAPRSIAHVMRGADAFRALGVDVSLPASRGGGRAGLVSLMRDDDDVEQRRRATTTTAKAKN